MLKNIFITSLLFISSYSYSAAGSWSPYSKISNIFIEGSDTVAVATITFATNIPDSYKNPSCLSNYITVDLSNEKGKAMYSHILAEELVDKEVRVTFPFCSAPRPLVHQLNL